jgi:hypothetical protein
MDLLEGQVVSLPPPVEVEEEQEYKVSCVEDSGIYENQLQFLIRRTGSESLSWEPAVTGVYKFQ